MQYFCEKTKLQTINFFIQSPIRLDHLTRTSNQALTIISGLVGIEKTTRVRHIEACYSTSVSSQLTAIGFPRIVHWNREFIISCWSQRHSNFFLLQKDLKTL